MVRYGVDGTMWWRGVAWRGVLSTGRFRWSSFSAASFFSFFLCAVLLAYPPPQTTTVGGCDKRKNEEKKQRQRGGGGYWERIGEIEMSAARLKSAKPLAYFALDGQRSAFECTSGTGSTAARAGVRGGGTLFLSLSSRHLTRYQVGFRFVSLFSSFFIDEQVNVCVF